MMAFAAPPEAMQEEAFAEYHLYTLPRRTTIKQNQSKQVSLLTASGVGVKKLYEYRGNESFYSRRIPPVDKHGVDVFLVFQNEEKNQLGMPLPAGIMRIYQEDSQGMQQFVGEDRIKHTPKDEKVRLKMGQAFDVVAERKQTDYERLSDHVHEAAFEIKVRNHKENDVTVRIVEPMMGEWRVLKASHDHVKEDSRTAVFALPTPKDGETVLTYRVRVEQ